VVDYATFLALEGHFALPQSKGPDENDWPPAYRNPDSPEVEAFRHTHYREIEFHIYVQFELDRQLAAVAAQARRAGMPLGLYHDLAIGSAADGSDAWAFGNLFVKGVEVGAPPDPYSDVGQTWGFPPVDPRRLTATRYDYWIRLLRNAMAHAGMLRIDHVMGLFRQFWVPDGAPATEGAYVQYPAEDLLGILALESRRHNTVIVGEDLGTVPPEVPPTLAQWGILSTRVMYFERDHEGRFNPSDFYSPRALVTATNHDHPPLAGFRTGRDLEIRHDLGLIRSEQELEEAREQRARACMLLQERLRAEGISFDDVEDPDEALCRAVHAFLARTPSPLVGVSLDDLAGETDPVNVPGWSRIGIAAGPDGCSAMLRKSWPGGSLNRHLIICGRRSRTRPRWTPATDRPAPHPGIRFYRERTPRLLGAVGAAWSSCNSRSACNQSATGSPGAPARAW
jgi:4-alpha-glucanotransferase